MRGWLIGAGILVLSTGPVRATARVSIDLTSQRMHVTSNEGDYDWPISSARSGFSTPGGSYAPTHLELMHYSKKYHMSPMPHAIFFRGGYAIHGTYATGSLGRPASHGCIRLSPGNASTLYSLVQREGARIAIRGTPPASLPFAERRHRTRGGDEYTEYAGDDSGSGLRVRRASSMPFYQEGYAYQPYDGYGVYSPF